MRSKKNVHIMSFIKEEEMARSKDKESVFSKVREYLRHYKRAFYQLRKKGAVYFIKH